MDFTFGIITINNIENINKVIDSIEAQNIPNYEIIIVGCNKTFNLTTLNKLKRKNCTCIPFDESMYSGWITKKKNIITQNAKYENIVYMHDYIVLDNNWYKGYLKNGNNFDVIINPIQNFDGSRFRDWVLNMFFLRGLYLINENRTNPTINAPDQWIQTRESVIEKYQINQNTQVHFLSYDLDGKEWQKYIYISGAYWVAKKNVMEEIPLNENLLWGQSEDVDWCQRVRNKYIFSCNKYSICKFIKQKD
jgi:glycosyltransferase involved in cell wall biosynthesis